MGIPEPKALQGGWTLPLVLLVLTLLMLATSSLLQQTARLLTAASDSHQYRLDYLASLPGTLPTGTSRLQHEGN